LQDNLGCVVPIFPPIPLSKSNISFISLLMPFYICNIANLRLTRHDSGKPICHHVFSGINITGKKLIKIRLKWNMDLTIEKWFKTYLWVNLTVFVHGNIIYHVIIFTRIISRSRGIFVCFSCCIIKLSSHTLTVLTTVISYFPMLSVTKYYGCLPANLSINIFT
jgi:hypothetical protein